MREEKVSFVFCNEYASQTISECHSALDSRIKAGKNEIAVCCNDQKMKEYSPGLKLRYLVLKQKLVLTKVLELVDFIAVNANG